MSELEGIRALCAETGANVIMASNFALGAVLMMKFSELAAGVFDSCEIIERHHRGKRDAPSGTAIATARLVERAMTASVVPRQEQGEVPGTRGGAVGPVNIHSVRLDGLVAHQEVVFGSNGETLTDKARHYGPLVLHARRRACGQSGRWDARPDRRH